MAEILRISDEVTVMRDGQWIATNPAAELNNESLIKLMVGRELSNQFPPKTNKPGEVLLEVEGLTGQYNQLKDVSFTARKGEILGLAGLDGSGRTETMESIFGIATRHSGTIKLEGKEVSNKNSRQSLQEGFVMRFIWNKTTFGKNMFAVGSNAEAANVSGVNVFFTTLMVHTLAGITYGYTGFIEAARIGSNTANTGLNYECDAIAACVIGGVSFVGGTGTIGGVVLGVFLLRIIFVGLNFLSVSGNMQYIIKGAIILLACSIDMRKYLTRK